MRSLLVAGLRSRCTDMAERLAAYGDAIFDSAKGYPKVCCARAPAAINVRTLILDLIQERNQFVAYGQRAVDGFRFLHFPLPHCVERQTKPLASAPPA